MLDDQGSSSLFQPASFIFEGRFSLASFGGVTGRSRHGAGRHSKTIPSPGLAHTCAFILLMAWPHDHTIAPSSSLSLPRLSLLRWFPFQAAYLAGKDSCKYCTMWHTLVSGTRNILARLPPLHHSNRIKAKNKDLTGALSVKQCISRKKTKDYSAER